jgi:hypothetical protein
MGLRTLVLLPEYDRLVLIWQGWCRTEGDDGSDIAAILGALEGLGKTRPPGHYSQVLRERSEGDDALLRSLDDAPLLPEGLGYAGLLPPDLDLNRPPAPDSFGARLQRRGERQMQAARAEVAGLGLDPEQHAPPPTLPPLPPLPPLPQLGAYLREIEQDAAARMAAAQADQARMLDQLEQEYQARGDDFAPIRLEIGGAHSQGPPAPLAPQHLQMLREVQATNLAQGQRVAEVEQMLADQALQARWRHTDRALLAGYVAHAHFMHAAPRAQGRFAQRQQAWVAERDRKSVV